MKGPTFVSTYDDSIDGIQMDGSRGEARRGEARLAAASFASFKPPFFVGKPALSKWKYLMLRGKGFASISRCARTHARGLSRTATGTYAGDNRGGQSYNARPDYLVRVSNVVNSYWQRR